MTDECVTADGALAIACTPYHAWLAWGQSLADFGVGRSQLVIFSAFDGASACLKAMQCAPYSPFSACHLFHHIRLFASPHQILLTSTALRHLIKRNRPRAVFVGNDDSIAVQDALRFANKRFSATGYYLEDGVGAYTGLVAEPRRGYRVKLFQQMYRHWDNISVLGTSAGIQKVLASFPGQVRPEVAAHREVYQLSKEALFTDATKRMAKMWLRSLGADPGHCLSNINAILVLSQRESLTDVATYRRTIIDILQKGQTDGLRFAVKYHPSSGGDDYLGLRPWAELLPTAAPVELFYVLGGPSIRTVVGDQSTGILTAKWLLDDSTVCSLRSLTQLPDARLWERFRAVGIEIV